MFTYNKKAIFGGSTLLGLLIILYMIYLSGMTSMFYGAVILNGVIAMYNILRTLKDQKLSLILVLSVFYLLFFTLIPLYQYTSKHYFYGFMKDAESYYISAMWLVLLSNIIFTSSYYSYFDRNVLNLKVARFDNNSVFIRTLLVLFLFVLVLMILGLGGPETFLFRDKRARIIGLVSKSFFLIYADFLCPLPLFVLFIHLVKSKFKLEKINYLFVGSFSLLALILNFPLSTPRYYTLIILCIVYGFFFLRKNDHGYINLLFMPIGIIVFRLFSYLRRESSREYFFKEDVGERLTISMDFDSFEMCSLGLNYVNEFGFMFGKNIMGAMLFFVPSAIWEDKPLSSGQVITTDLFRTDIWMYMGYSANFHNVSQPLVGELYLSFGLIGVIIGFWFLGYFMSSLDRTVYHYLNSKGYCIELALLVIVYSAFAGMTFFIMRGTLLSSFAYSSGITLSFLAAMYLSGLKLKFSKIIA